MEGDLDGIGLVSIVNWIKGGNSHYPGADKVVDTRFGVSGTSCEGIFFTESEISSARVVRHIHVEISRQNADLMQVKTRMAQQAQSAGATAIMNFRYGQKKHKWWELVFTFKWDTESWHGEGDAVIV